MKKQLKKRVVSIVMTFVMLFTVIGVLPPVNVQAETTTSLTMHFNCGDTAWEDVYAYLCVGGSWNKVPNYEYAGTWPGAEVEANTANESWYSFTIDVAIGSEMKVIFNNNAGTQTSNIEFTTEQAKEEYWVVGTDATTTTTAPEGWVAGTYNAPINPAQNSAFVSPVVNADKTVTFCLEDITGQYADAQSVCLMGTLNGTDWSNGLAMQKTNEGTDGATLYKVTTPVQNPGVYEYKFKIDNNWITDPLNDKYSDGGNSKVVVSGLESASFDISTGEETQLPETLKYYDAEGNATNASVTYTVKDSALADSVTINDAKVTVANTVTMDSIVLIASDVANPENTAEVTLNIVSEIYNYTIYYYDSVDAHMSVDAADIHVWDNGGTESLSAVEFTSLETLADGKTWLKATLSTSVTNLGMIPRSKGTWAWQTGDHFYNNTEKQKDVTLYIVYGDDANTYTELPEVEEARERYVMVEFYRTEGDYEGWNLFTWNSGMGSEVVVYPTELNGKQYFIVPVKDSKQDFNLNFCVRKSTEENAWAEKDGGDHAITVPADQTVVKAIFEQGEGVTGHYAYNTGYENKASQDMITFLYRDDMAMLEGKLADMAGKVFVVVEGTSYEMTYNTEQYRFEYNYEAKETGEYEYYYVINGEKILDAFNSNVNEDESASVASYKKYDISIQADAYYDTMD